MIRYARPRALLAISSLAALALLAAGCGGGGGGSSDTKSAQDWADGVCSAVNTWTDSLKSAGQSLTGGNLSKNSLESAATDVKDATSQFEDDLKGLGKPDTASGDKAKQSVDELTSNIHQDVDTMDGAIKDVQNGGSVMPRSRPGCVSGSRPPATSRTCSRSRTHSRRKGGTRAASSAARCGSATNARPMPARP